VWGYIHEVIIASGTETIAHHKRSYEKENSIYARYTIYLCLNTKEGLWIKLLL